MADEANGPFLKYALFCQDTAEEENGDLTLKGVVDLLDVPEPDGSSALKDPVLTTVDSVSYTHLTLPTICSV